jgi:hypothetical protein
VWTLCRITHPEKYKAEDYFQRSWSGADFKNSEWVKRYGQL